ncbi:DUF72 domain-containing protein [Anaerobaca lacustris]|uniref:DUF72 domain-containing protein n=1 Tax=Anaerobaca lacustris TaxID=3044600 RepID=A0AAW6TZG9_9BACT|nr:DUF72 domain-containing protein [Sedimentisphaerales bacterium M17dextr]
MVCPISIGIAGWSYADWQGIVYIDPKVDQLVYVSGFVDCIEINSTFYRPPFAKTVRSWLERTSQKPEFFFTAKLHQSFTHEGKVDPEIVKQFHRGFEPFLEAKKLRHLLVQFRYDFSDGEPARRHLADIVGRFQEAFSLVVELRHVSWESQEALDFLGGLGVTVCNLDYPMSKQSFKLPHCTVGRSGYFRMHGRNAEKWFSKAGRDEVYNYYYSERELTGIKQRLDELGKAFESLTVIANNHYRGAELANALELKALVSGQQQPIPEGLLKTYPNLARIAVGR